MKRSKIHKRSRAPPFQTSFRTFSPSNVAAFFLRVISSNLGCRQVPGEGVEVNGAVAIAVWSFGVVVTRDIVTQEDI